jgi:alpha-beta hydrolase superfamily lysophospholipase
MGGALPVLVARALRDRPSTSRRTARWVSWAGAIACGLGVIAPRSPALAAGLHLTFLALWAGEVVRLSRALSQGARGGWRSSVVGTGAFAVLFPWGAVAIVVGNTVLGPLPARPFHQRPILHEGERVLELTTADGYALSATYTPGERGAGGVVLVHGVSDGRSRFAPWAKRLGDAGHHVLRFDLRAHGTSEGAVCTYGQREALDVEAAVDALADAARLPADRIAVIGASMGGGTVLAASPALARRGVPAIVLLAPASDYRVLANERLAFLGPLRAPSTAAARPVSLAAGQVPMVDWSPRERATPARDLPTLVFHGTADRQIPPRLTRTLVAHRTATEVVWLEGVGHVDTPAAVLRDPSAWSVLDAFLDAHVRRGDP